MRKEKVIIVEDEAVISMLLEETLQNLGYSEITVTHRAEDAERLLKNDPFDIILMDINLGGTQDGIDLILSLNEVNQWTPVIYITGNSDFKTFTKAKHSNPANFLIKPVNENNLMIQLELALYKKENISNWQSVNDAIRVNFKLKSLSKTELKVVELIVLGLSNKMIADEMNRSVKTVEGHRTKIMKKLNGNNTADIVRIAVGY